MASEGIQGGKWEWQETRFISQKFKINPFFKNKAMIKYIMNFFFPLKSVRLKIGIITFAIFRTYFYVYNIFWVFSDSKAPAKDRARVNAVN